MTKPPTLKTEFGVILDIILRHYDYFMHSLCRLLAFLSGGSVLVVFGPRICHSRVNLTQNHSYILDSWPNFIVTVTRTNSQFIRDFPTTVSHNYCDATRLAPVRKEQRELICAGMMTILMMESVSYTHLTLPTILLV